LTIIVIKRCPESHLLKKGWKIYEDLKKKVMSKTRDARITSSEKGTRLKGKNKDKK
jgi:hypothetical protein